MEGKMLSPIKNLILRDHAPTQVLLYSVPIVNVLVRAFQSYHSLDNVASTHSFRIKKENFKSHMKTAIGIQLALTISTLALCILLPPAKTIRLHINSIFSVAVALTLSNLICDSFWRFKAPRIEGSANETGW
jgi:hypothetical protein